RLEPCVRAPRAHRPVSRQCHASSVDTRAARGVTRRVRRFASRGCSANRVDGGMVGALTLDSSASAVDSARLLIARAILGDDIVVGTRLGTITLREHQRTAAARLLAIMTAHRGAMLAEPVGLGKTYVALAVARRWESRVVIAPASLRDMRRGALAAAGVDAALVTP